MVRRECVHARRSRYAVFRHKDRDNTFEPGSTITHDTSLDTRAFLRLLSLRPYSNDGPFWTLISGKRLVERSEGIAAPLRASTSSIGASERAAGLTGTTLLPNVNLTY